jgi:cation diffusion facilitator CzcD-associated flavoprotein CzcO
MRDIVDEENLHRYIQLETEITNAVWDEENSQWTVQSRCTRGGNEDVREERFRFLVNAAGFLK